MRPKIAAAHLQRRGQCGLPVLTVIRLVQIATGHHQHCAAQQSPPDTAAPRRRCCRPPAPAPADCRTRPARRQLPAPRTFDNIAVANSRKSETQLSVCWQHVAPLPSARHLAITAADGSCVPTCSMSHRTAPDSVTQALLHCHHPPLRRPGHRGLPAPVRHASLPALQQPYCASPRRMPMPAPERRSPHKGHGSMPLVCAHFRITLTLSMTGTELVIRRARRCSRPP